MIYGISELKNLENLSLSFDLSFADSLQELVNLK